MAVRYLSDMEVQRLRYELGANLLEIGAEPYIDHMRIFDVIQDNLASSEYEVTACTTNVTSTGVTTLTLGAVDGLDTGTRIVLDQDEAQEVVSVRRVTGLDTISVICRKLHTATFPVEIESGLTIVRGLLWELVMLAEKIRESTDFDGIKQVDEVIFQDTTKVDMTVHSGLLRQQNDRRENLASAVNLMGVLHSLGYAKRHGGTGFALR